MVTLPSPADYPNGGFMDAYNDYQRQVWKERDAALLAKLVELGARTTTCPCDYGPFDSCPNCD